MIKCPNCKEMVEGFLVINAVYGIEHCGCFYDSQRKCITQWLIEDVYDAELEKKFDN